MNERLSSNSRRKAIFYQKKVRRRVFHVAAEARTPLLQVASGHDMTRQPYRIFAAEHQKSWRVILTTSDKLRLFTSSRFRATSPFDNSRATATQLLRSRYLSRASHCARSRLRASGAICLRDNHILVTCATSIHPPPGRPPQRATPVKSLSNPQNV